MNWVCPVNAVTEETKTGSLLLWTKTLLPTGNVPMATPTTACYRRVEAAVGGALGFTHTQVTPTRPCPEWKGITTKICVNPILLYYSSFFPKIKVVPWHLCLWAGLWLGLCWWAVLTVHLRTCAPCWQAPCLSLTNGWMYEAKKYTLRNCIIARPVNYVQKLIHIKGKNADAFTLPVIQICIINGVNGIQNILFFKKFCYYYYSACFSLALFSFPLNSRDT